MIQGFAAVEHVVPAGAKVLELKTCENCGRPFARSRPPLSCSPEGRTLGARYCAGCNAAYLLPPDTAEYRAMLPTTAEMAHRSYLPHYDNSLLRGELRP